MMTDARPAAPGTPSFHDVTADVQLALDLANGRATGPAANALRGRLRSYIEGFADRAKLYAEGLEDSRARDIAMNTIRHANAVVTDAVQDPAANLRLLAKAAEITARYAASERTS